MLAIHQQYQVSLLCLFTVIFNVLSVHEIFYIITVQLYNVHLEVIFSATTLQPQN